MGHCPDRNAEQGTTRSEIDSQKQARPDRECVGNGSKQAKYPIQQKCATQKAVTEHSQARKD